MKEKIAPSPKRRQRRDYSVNRETEAEMTGDVQRRLREDRADEEVENLQQGRAVDGFLLLCV